MGSGRGPKGLSASARRVRAAGNPRCRHRLRYNTILLILRSSLDAPCIGSWAVDMAKEFPYAEVTGLDVVPANLASCVHLFSWLPYQPLTSRTGTRLRIVASNVMTSIRAWVITETLSMWSTPGVSGQVSKISLGSLKKLTTSCDPVGY